MSKLRVRNARYPDAHHIELLLQTQVESSKYLRLPPVDRLHMLSFLNHHISRGEVFITVTENKLTGFAVMRVTSFPWNPQYFVYHVAMLHVTTSHHEWEEAGELLLREMVSLAQRNNGALICETQAAIPTNIPQETFEKMMHWDGMTYCYQPAQPEEQEMEIARE